MRSFPLVLPWLAILVACLAASCASADASGQSEERTALFEGRRVHYLDRGTGPRALVFVHGWCCDRSVWRFQLEDLDEWRCIAVDLPGHGRSELPARDCTPETFARAVACVLDQAGIERAVVVAHSNGSAVTRQFYRLFPARTAGLIIVDGALRSYFDDPQEAQQFVAPMRAPDWREQVAKAFIDPMLAPMKDDHERARIRELMLSAHQQVAVESFLAVCDPKVWGEDRIQVPALFLMARSPFWDDEYRAWVQKLVPHMEWHELEGVSHFVMLDAPDVVAQLSRAFLERIHFATTEKS